MKLLILLTTVACLQVSARGFGQSVTLTLKDATLEQVFKEIRKQTGYSFVYTREQIKNAPRITCQLKNTALKAALEVCFRNQSLSFIIEDHYIVIQTKSIASANAVETSISNLEIRGRVVDENKEPLEGVSIRVKSTGRIFTTNLAGEFIITEADSHDILFVTAAEMEPEQVEVSGRNSLYITLRRKVANLDETILIGYGTTTKRYNTGSVGKVSAKEIARQPVSNPIATLSGRIPGLLISQSNGLPGSNISILIRGENSLRQGTQPLIIVDGVPFMLNSARLTDVNSTGNQSLFNTIDPGDIESIEVLKDASATAIYGSQGANGVILITTKKGKSGKMKFDFSVYMGFKKVTRTMSLLNTPQYLEMRNEAFENDGIIPNASNAPDLVIWDQTKYTDWKKELIGGTAKNSNIKFTMSGGTANTSFLFAGNLYSETSLFPGANPAYRGTGRMNINHLSTDKKFTVNLSTSYGADIKRQSLSDLTTYIFLPPNAPDMYDSLGKLRWSQGIENPYAHLHRKFKGQTYSFFASANIGFNITRELTLGTNIGYNRVESNESAQIPIRSLRPDPTTRGTYFTSDGSMEGWIAEPQISYNKLISKSKIELMAGSSFQSRKQTGISVTGRGYTDDDLLGNMAAAATLSVSNRESVYKYVGVFGRLNYIYSKKYILEINLRRDGSSRFGPAERFSNFGAISAGWIFSEEKFIKKGNSILNFGKLRTSYGTTGNDQIGDYQFLDGWVSNSSYAYGTGTGFLPQKLFNANLQWERTRKFQAGMDLELINSRVAISIDYYRHVSNNQLVFYALPATTGFSTILKNLDASIQNSGFEAQSQVKIIRGKKFTWESGFNISIPRNKLLKYPDLQNSSDASLYIVGEPVRIVKRYQLNGVDPETGLFTFVDQDLDGNIVPLKDYVNVGYLGQQYFGGIENNFTLQDWSLSIFFQFVKQTGNNYLTSLVSSPGTLTNQPVSVLERWQHPGDMTEIQRFTSTVTPAYVAFNNYLNSSAIVTDASFLRLKNISFAWNAPGKFLTKARLQNLRLFINAQDMITFTSYKGADPETRSVQSLPLLKTIACGVQITL